MGALNQIEIKKLLKEQKDSFFEGCWRLIEKEMYEFKNSLNSFHRKGYLHNIPSKQDFRKMWSQNGFEVYVIMKGEEMIGFHTLINYSLINKEGDLNICSYTHKFSFLQTIKKEFNTDKIVYLDVALLKKEERGHGYISRTVDKIKEDYQDSILCMLIYPFNAYALRVAQKLDFKLFLKRGFPSIYAYDYTNKGHWLFKEEEYWIPLVFYKDSAIQGKNGSKKTRKNEYVLLHILNCRNDYVLATIDINVDNQTFKNKGSLIDRVIGYLFLTLNLTTDTSDRKICLEDYDNFDDKDKIKKYYDYGEKIQGEAYKKLKEELIKVIEKIRSEKKKEKIKGVDLGSGTYRWEINDVEINRIDKIIREGTVIDLKKLPDFSEYDFIIAKHFLTRFYNYNRKECYDLDAKKLLLYNLIENAIQNDQVIILMEPKILDRKSVDINNVKNILQQLIPDLREENEICQCASFWWYGLANNLRSLEEYEKIIGRYEELLNINRIDVNCIDSLRCERIYVLESKMRFINRMYYADVMGTVKEKKELGKMLEEEQFEEYTKKEILSHPYLKKRIVTYMEEFILEKDFPPLEKGYLFLVSNKPPPYFKDEAYLNKYLHNQFDCGFLIFKDNKNGFNKIISWHEEFYLPFLKDYYNNLFEKLMGLISLNERFSILSVTIGRFIPKIRGTATISENICIPKNFKEIDDLFYFLSRKLSIQLNKYIEEVIYSIVSKHARRSAVAAILTESYAHNIGAHGLEGLKIYLMNQWQDIKSEVLNIQENQSILRLRTELLNSMVPFDNNTIKEMIKTHSNFPEYLRYLQGKSEFWAAIARGGVMFGGEISNMWELINDFAKNNLLMGSLGSSEEYKGIRFIVKYNNEDYDLGVSTIDDDLRYRFEEENLQEGGGESYHQERTNISSYKYDKIKELKEELEKIEIFLPEGVVGQQAVYTIWENIIRNVKHCKKENDLIPFVIEIKNEEDKKWVEITSWIDLDSQKEDELESKVNEMKNWKGILDENNKPNMGGTSQNILCAGMVFGQDFEKTEELQKTSNKKIMDFSEEKKRITFTFKIWKGAPVGSLKDIEKETTDYDEPLGRFKIIKLANEEEKDNLLKRPFFIRYVINNNGKGSDRVDDNVNDNNESFSKLYQKWIEYFYGEKILELPLVMIDKVGRKYNQLINTTDEVNKYSYYFYHGEENKDRFKAEVKIEYKNHDSIGRVVNEITKNFVPQNAEKFNIAKVHHFELLEILETSMEIYDNRLYKLAEKVEEKLSEENPSLANLKVEVYREEISQIKGENQEEKHFGIYHLSFIEQITGKKNDVAIQEFFNTQKYKHLLKRYKFIIITTGRGRDWWDGLDEKLKKQIKFIPIENLERCFEDAAYHAPKSPAIGLKYALVKTIFGS